MSDARMTTDGISDEEIAAAIGDELPDRLPISTSGSGLEELRGVIADESAAGNEDPDESSTSTLASS